MTGNTSISTASAGKHLTIRLAELESHIKQEPGNEDSRWTLVELLCLKSDWQRALKQLQLLAKRAPAWHTQAQLIRILILAQHIRSEVFSGKRTPMPVIDEPEWVRDLYAALVANAEDRVGDADQLRLKALEHAHNQSGVCHWQSRGLDNETSPGSMTESKVELTEARYSWIGDSDTRLGPVCEIIIAGSYRWLPFSDIARLEIQQPSRWLDLLWLPAKLRLQGTSADGQDIHGFLPARYCASPCMPALPSSEESEAIQLARLTMWHEIGETGVFAYGQKTWMTDGLDWPLLDIRLLDAEKMEKDPA